MLRVSVLFFGALLISPDAPAQDGFTTGGSPPVLLAQADGPAFAACEAELKACRSKLENLRDDLDFAERDLKGIEAEIKRLKDEIAALDANIAALAGKEKALKICLDQLEQDAKQIGARIKTDDNGRVIGIIPPAAGGDDIIQAKLAALGTTMDACNKRQAEVQPLRDKNRKENWAAERGTKSSILADRMRALPSFKSAVSARQKAVSDAEAECKAIEARCVALRARNASAPPDAGASRETAPPSDNPDMQDMPALPEESSNSGGSSASGTESDTSPAGQKSYMSVAGIWATNWGRMELKSLDERNLSGRYETDNGRLSLTVFAEPTGDIYGARIVLHGRWAEDDSGQKCGTTMDGTPYWGWVKLVFNEKLTSFSGEWGYCNEEATAGTWSGTRE